MEDTLTDKNHYNPCFWTAYWNSSYLQSLRNGEKVKSKAREQEIFSLNLRSDKIIKTKTKNVFFEKGAGFAAITKEDDLNYCKRAFPEKFNELQRYYEENSEDHFIDFENHFTGIENLYRPFLEQVICKKNIETIEEKTFLSFFIYTQIARNHNHWSAAVSIFEKNEMAKFEMFLDFRYSIADHQRLQKLIYPFVFSCWKLYRTKEEIFPISDNPVLIRPLHIYIPLAPDLLLEIDLKVSASEVEVCKALDVISPDQYSELEKRTIENSSREIIFGKKKLLEDWQKSTLFRDHLKKLPF